MLKILLISLIGVASAVNFLDFGNGLKKLTHNRIVEHFGVDAVDKGKVEALPVEDKIKSFLKKIDSLFNQSPVQIKSGQKLKLGKYLFQNCSAAEGEKATFIVRSLTVSPDPAVLPGTLTIQFDINNLLDITKLEINVEMYRTSGGTTVKLPCFGELFGSCDYGNVCDLLSAITECPDPFIQYNIPCKCPVPKGTYVMPELSVDIDAEVLISGDYNVTAHMFNTKGGDFVGCYNLQFTLED
ncbi:ganglioside GM2 activator-like isoform X1 [Pomacea canaliculata]|uniref:ganglioside GM2 activator-like isoform X1 n=1 Tax=Pomacea canaliculata TaxID=400727 RepID=UPI000D739DB8|nr:ganglioside GM2 activator-like isoform X1 [Pomacea canaliculata]